MSTGTDPARRARLLAALRSAVLERARSGPASAGHLWLERRRRDCASLARLGRPADEARTLALRLDAALGLGIGTDAIALERFALDLTALLAEVYAGLLAAGSGRDEVPDGREDGQHGDHLR